MKILALIAGLLVVAGFVVLFIGTTVCAFTRCRHCRGWHEDEQDEIECRNLHNAKLRDAGESGVEQT